MVSIFAMKSRQFRSTLSFHLVLTLIQCFFYNHVVLRCQLWYQFPFESPNFLMSSWYVNKTVSLLPGYLLAGFSVAVSNTIFSSFLFTWFGLFEGYHYPAMNLQLWMAKVRTISELKGEWHLRLEKKIGFQKSVEIDLTYTCRRKFRKSDMYITIYVIKTWMSRSFHSLQGLLCKNAFTFCELVTTKLKIKQFAKN